MGWQLPCRAKVVPKAMLLQEMPSPIRPFLLLGTHHPSALSSGSFLEFFHSQNAFNIRGKKKKNKKAKTDQHSHPRKIAEVPSTLKTSFRRIQNRPRCFKKMSFAFNPEEGRMVTKEGSDPKWILLSSTWFILNVKVQGYKNKWIGWGHLWILRHRHFTMFGGCAQIFVCANFVIVEIKEVLSPRNIASRMMWKINKWGYRAPNPKEGKESKLGLGWYYPHTASGYLFEKPLSDIAHHRLDRFIDWME